ncbi:membrane protein insertase YidC, partial [Acinetobacter baumannii]
SGWVRQGGPAPTHEAGFRPVGGPRFALAPGARELVVPFEWTGPDGVTIRREYLFERGSYVVRVRDTVINRGTAPWQGWVYRQLT